VLLIQLSPKPGLVVAHVIVVSYAGFAGTSVPLLTYTIDCTSRELAWHPPNEVKGRMLGHHLSRRPRSRERVTAWLRVEAPSLR
jgi:hypothetical protein